MPNPLPRPTTAVFPGYARDDTEATCRLADAWRAVYGYLLPLALTLVFPPANTSAQPADATAELRFEAVSVKLLRPEDSRGMLLRAANSDNRPTGWIPMRDPGWVQIKEWPLHHLIAVAYEMRDHQVSGPAWMKEQLFTIEATVPFGTPQGQLRAMLQRFLTERFGLTLHRETRAVSGFALCVGKNGPKLEPFTPPEPGPPPASPEEALERKKARMEKMKESLAALRRSDVPRVVGHRTMTVQGTIAGLARSLTSFTGGPVSDETGLTGTYNVTLETWPATDDDPGQTIFAALEKLGLRLTERKIPLDLLIVDQVSKTPSAN